MFVFLILLFRNAHGLLVSNNKLSGAPHYLIKDVSNVVFSCMCEISTDIDSTLSDDAYEEAYELDEIAILFLLLILLTFKF